MKTTPWTKIKAEYLQGVTPKELALKYKISAKAIHEKSSKENWTAAKARIAENLQEKVSSKIDKITNEAIDVLSQIVNNSEARDCDRVSACKTILDISGLKSSKQEISGISGVTVSINHEAVEVEG